MDLSRVTWRKSRRSGNGANCVEVAHTGTTFLVRDSKNPEGAKLTCTPTEWQAFIGGLKDGKFD